MGDWYPHVPSPDEIPLAPEVQPPKPKPIPPPPLPDLDPRDSRPYYPKPIPPPPLPDLDPNRIPYRPPVRPPVPPQWPLLREPFYYDPKNPPKHLKPSPQSAYASLIVDLLIFDLNGDGIQTTALENGVNFDHDTDGFAEKTAWVDKRDALLVYDRNGNGKIDDGSELFGDHTVLSNGQVAKNGFEALKDFDSNGDGVFDANDDAWGLLRLWQDKNGNGIADAGEFLTLDQGDIEIIGLNYSNVNTIDKNGNIIRQTGNYTKNNGTAGEIANVWFNTDTFDTVSTNIIDVNETIAALPDMEGTGFVESLHQTMAKDKSGALQSLIDQYCSENNLIVRRNLTTDIILTWAGVIDYRSKYPETYLDSRMIRAVELFAGDRLGSFSSQSQNSRTSAAIANSFKEIVDYAYCSLNLQTLYSAQYTAAFNLHLNDDKEAAYVAFMDSLAALHSQLGGEHLKNFFSSLSTVSSLGADISNWLSSLYLTSDCLDDICARFVSDDFYDIIALVGFEYQKNTNEAGVVSPQNSKWRNR